MNNNSKKPNTKNGKQKQGKRRNAPPAPNRPTRMAVYRGPSQTAIPKSREIVGLQSAWLQGLPQGSDYLRRLGKNWYMDALIDPLSANAARYPGDQSIPTAVYKSVRVLDIPINTTLGGRFNAFVTPRLGSNETIDSFSVYVATENYPYGSAETADNSANYARGVGSNPRIDPNALLLCQAPSEGVYITSAIPLPVELNGRVAPFGDTDYKPGMGPASVRFTNGKTLAYASSYTPYGIRYVATRPTNSTPERASTFFLDAGVYLVEIDINKQGDGDTAVRLAFGDGVTNDTTFDAQGYQHVGVPKIRSVASATEGKKISFLVSVTGQAARANTNWFSLQIDSPPTPDGAGTAYAWGFIQRIRQTEVADTGAVKMIRPVACSALMTYIGSDFNNGGQIAAAFVSPEALKTNYLNNDLSSDADGELDYHNFTAITRIPGSYSGPLRTGAYAFWTPSGTNQILFRTPSEHVKYTYGGLVFGGNWAPTEANNATQIRLTVVTHYEYTTTSMLFQSVYSPFEQRTEEEALKLLTTFPRAMPNDAHDSLIQKIRNTLRRGAEIAAKIAPVALSML